MTRLLLYHDFGSVFCRLALPVARAAAAAAELELDVVPYELVPAPAILPPPEALRPELEAAGPAAAALGIELALPPRIPRTRKAHEAVAHARRQGLALELAEVIYDAVWRRGLDISRLDVLADLGAEAGLDPAALHVALGVDAEEAGVVAAQREAEAAGIAELPTFRVGDEVRVGLVGSDELATWLAARRPEA